MMCHYFSNGTCQRYRDRGGGGAGGATAPPLFCAPAPPGGVLPYKRLMGMCRWMGSHFHDWSDYNGVAFSIDLLEWGRKF